MNIRSSLLAFCVTFGLLNGVETLAAAPRVPRVAGDAASPGRARPCPADELSCGKQKPVKSDGIRPFTNGDMGLSVVFPRNALVCMGRSGNTPRGFYSWIRFPTNCSEPGPSDAPAYVRIYASYNTLEWAAPQQAFLSCKPLSPVLATRLGERKLEFPGHHSAVCQHRIQNGVELTVIALAGPKCDGIRSVTYDATLGTTWLRFGMDVKNFENFLRSAKIGNPKMRC